MNSFDLKCVSFGVGVPKPVVIQQTDPLHIDLRATVKGFRYRMVKTFKGRRYVVSENLSERLKRVTGGVAWLT